MRRPPRRDLRALGAKFAFCAPRGRRVRTSLGRDDVGPCPRYPGASAGRVADSGAAREVARDDRQTRRFAISLPTLGVAVGSQGCGNAL